jgi:phage FluMu protein Com
MPIKRDRHPALYPQRMQCKQINEITQTDHGTFLVSYLRITDENATKDCKKINKIIIDPSNPQQLEFSFEQYFTEETLAQLNEAFLRGEYDDLGDLPQF